MWAAVPVPVQDPCARSLPERKTVDWHNPG